MSNESTTDERVIIYTDGGSSPNPGPGGWAAILQYDGREKEIMGNQPHTTNNRMELTAATEALKSITHSCKIDLYTDSEYLKNGITRWIKTWLAAGRLEPGEKQVANADLWLDLYPLTQWHDVSWHWVRGHAGNELNERVDRLVHQARLPLLPKVEQNSQLATLYVKSSCSNGNGGWAAVIEHEGKHVQLSGRVDKTTNNRMELQAVIEGLSQIDPAETVRVVTQSDYLHQGATRWIHGWKKRHWKKKDGMSVSNEALWRQLDKLISARQLAWINARGQEVEGIDLAASIAKTARTTDQ